MKVKNQIDFIIPSHPKDFPSLQFTVDGIKKISCLRKIFVISKSNPHIDGVIHIPESNFDKFVVKKQIKDIWDEKNKSLSHRSKWIYQQFLKLLSFKVIEELSDSFVIVDSDTIFLKDVDFDLNSFYYCKAEEYHIPYLNPIKKLLDVESTIGFSCISHHMIFNKQKLSMMIDEIEKRFNKKFVDIVLDIIDYNEGSCFSEWDLYSNYMILNHPEMSFQRQLKWQNIPFLPSNVDLLNLQEYFDFVSCHAYYRGIE